MENIYVAMEETFAVPDGDRFMTINKCENADFAFGYRYPNVERSDDLVIIQIAVSDNRIREQKLALYKEMNKELGARQLPA